MTQKDPHAKKARPTPRRREREAANRRPLVPEDRKQARREMQDRARAEREAVREGIARGDDRYLRPQERGPQKRFMRDFIDARFTLGELMLPVVVVLLFTTFLNDPMIASVAMLVAWTLIACSVLEGLILAAIIKRRIVAVVGRDRLERGISLATILRSMQLRMLRMPKSRVARGEKIEFTGR